MLTVPYVRHTTATEPSVQGAYVGMPLAEDGVANASPTPAQNKLHATGCYGFLAFVVGAILALIGWVANQGWTIASLLLFGEFSCTFASAWKHVILCLLGSLCTSIAFWAAFRQIFASAFAHDEDEDEDKPSFNQDIADSVQELGELGFVVGYFASQSLLTNAVFKPLLRIGIEYQEPKTFLTGSTLAIVMLWVLGTKLRDHRRAVKRATNVDRISSAVGKEMPVAYVQLV